MRPGPNGGGLSRKATPRNRRESQAARDGLRHLDQIHRWDDVTPIEETMEALHDVVRMHGQARYLGASSMHAWQFAKAQHVAERHGWTRFVSMQNHYNLIYREEERELVPLCRGPGRRVDPWSPLARGYLARAPEAKGTKRSETDRFGKTLYSSMAEADQLVVAVVDKLARKRNLPHAQIALAWLLQNDAVSGPHRGRDEDGAPRDGGGGARRSTVQGRKSRHWRRRTWRTPSRASAESSERRATLWVLEIIPTGVFRWVFYFDKKTLIFCVRIVTTRIHFHSQSFITYHNH